MGKPSLLPAKLVQQHCQCCHLKPGRCGLCHWAKKKNTFLKVLRNEKWLKVCLKGKTARVGCTFCAVSDTGGPWADFEQSPFKLRAHTLQRREKSEAHKKAEENYQSRDAGVYAPPAAEFKDALKKMSQGGSAREGRCPSDKRTQVRWALSESILALGRERLQSALSIALMRDERKGRLLLRYRACLPDLSVTSGVLGFLPTEGFSDSLAKASKKATLSFCTPLANPPRGFQARAATQNSEVDQNVLTNIIAKTEILCTDAAAPELLASRLLAGQRPYATGDGGKDEFFRKVKLVARDASHASTRLLKRPFEAHPELAGLMEEFISGSDSFAQKVWHSPLYTQWWNNLAKNGSSLSAAKHRFGSYLIPLSKLCRNMQSMIQLCEKIQAVRSDSTAWCAKLLQTFSGKKALLLALAADAAATCLELTRCCDSEGFDISQLNSHARQFGASIHMLFIEEKVFELPTYTKQVMDALESSPIQIVHSGRAKEIRVSNREKCAALKVLKEWAVASEKTLATEFPSWDILSCFDVFNLEGRTASLKKRPEVTTSLAKLAKVFGLEAEDLNREFTSILPIATGLQKQGGLDNRAAWAAAVNRLQKRKEMNEKYTSKSLLKATHPSNQSFFPRLRFHSEIFSPLI